VAPPRAAFAGPLNHVRDVEIAVAGPRCPSRTASSDMATCMAQRSTRNKPQPCAGHRHCGLRISGRAISAAIGDQQVGAKSPVRWSDPSSILNRPKRVGSRSLHWPGPKGRARPRSTSRYRRGDRSRRSSHSRAVGVIIGECPLALLTARVRGLENFHLSAARPNVSPFASMLSRRHLASNLEGLLARPITEDPGVRPHPEGSAGRRARATHAVIGRAP